MVSLLTYIIKENGGSEMKPMGWFTTISTWRYSLYDADYSIKVGIDYLGFNLVFYRHRFLWFPKFLVVKSYKNLKDASAALKKYNQLLEQYTLMEEPFDVEFLNEED